MKALRLIALALCVGVAFTTAEAKKPKKDKKDTETAATETPAPVKKNTTVTQECMQNLSLFTTSCKHKNYADALGPWESAYKECPSAHKNIYVLGVRIVNWQIEQTTDPAEKEALFQKLMKLHDDQILYFGEDPKSPKADILARKASYHLLYKPEDKKSVYPWLKEAVYTLGASCEPAYIQSFIVTSSELYKQDNSLAEQFIQDYTTSNAALEQIIAAAPAAEKEALQATKNNLDALFAISGVADCAKLNEIYASTVETHKNDVDFLLRTMRFFKKFKCTEADAYFAASTYAHAIKPSAESATGLGNMCFKKEDYKQAIEYFQEAATLAETPEDAADNYMRLATCYNSLKNSVKAREFAKEALKKNPNMPSAHILLGYLYANSGSISDDPVLNKAKYWAAVDQFIKAKNVDANGEFTEQANSLIRTYSAHFPSTEEIFMHPDIEEGKSYFVGGWISESTTVRAK